jgi:hypothetical protein
LSDAFEDDVLRVGEVDEVVGVDENRPYK